MRIHNLSNTMSVKSLFFHSHTLPFLLFIIFSGLYFFTTVGIMNSLNASQYALTQALAEKRTITIDNYVTWVYLDYAEHNGQKYSYRSPGESFLAVPFYLLAKFLQPFAAAPYNGNHVGIDQDSVIEALTSMYNAVFGAGAIVLLYCIAYMLTKSKPSSLIAAVTLGGGTLLWRYAAAFQRFSLSAFFLLALVYLALQPNKKLWHYTTYGIFSGLLILIDPSILLMIAVISIYFFITNVWKKYELRLFIATIAPACIPLFIFLLYNYFAFGSPLSSSYLHGPAGRVYNDSKNYYLIPLFPSFWVNLFSNAPIPRAVYPDSMWNNEIFRLRESVEWSTRNNYKGVITQSPYLIFALCGLVVLIREKRGFGITILICALLWHIQMSMFSGFYAPTAYDTHYFLPEVVLVSIGLASAIQFMKLEIRRLKYILLPCTAIVIGWSIYNAWYSVLTNFGPHVTGEHKFDLAQLQQPVFGQRTFWPNLSALFIETIPNIYNAPLFVFFYLPLFFLVYMLLFQKRIFHNGVK